MAILWFSGTKGIGRLIEKHNENDHTDWKAILLRDFERDKRGDVVTVNAAILAKVSMNKSSFARNAKKITYATKDNSLETLEYADLMNIIQENQRKKFEEELKSSILCEECEKYVDLVGCYVKSSEPNFRERYNFWKYGETTTRTVKKEVTHLCCQYNYIGEFDKMHTLIIADNFNIDYVKREIRYTTSTVSLCNYPGNRINNESSMKVINNELNEKITNMYTQAKIVIDELCNNETIKKKEDFEFLWRVYVTKDN